MGMESIDGAIECVGELVDPQLLFTLRAGEEVLTRCGRAPATTDANVRGEGEGEVDAETGEEDEEDEEDAEDEEAEKR